jgi:hypothetical protein
MEGPLLGFKKTSSVYDNQEITQIPAVPYFARIWSVSKAFGVSWRGITDFATASLCAKVESCTPMLQTVWPERYWSVHHDIDPQL